MSDIIGIDLGTASSAVAVYRNGRPTVITTSEGERILSLVTFTRNGEASIGRRASRQAAINPSGTVYSVKRLLGRQFDDPVVQLMRSQHPFVTVRRAGDGRVEILTPGSDRAYSVEEVFSWILRHLKREAETYLGSPVRRAVLAVPANFNDNQRHAAREAGRMAGLEIMRVINEPAAAALAYGARHDEQRQILVIDLGGGHYDVSLLEINDGAVTVYSSHGDPALGGTDWDSTIADYLADEFLKYHGIELKRDPHAVHRLRTAAEEARKQLTDHPQAVINLPFITSGAAGPRHLNVTLTREKFEAETASLNARLSLPIERVLADAGVHNLKVDSVLMIGGSSAMRVLKDTVRRTVGSVPIEVDNRSHLVALGAALQAGHLAGEIHDVALHDVTPLSLGVETMGGLMTPIIPRNTPIPVKHTEVFSTTEDNQTDVEVHVLQGERSMAADNIKLGVFHLRGIPPAPRGVPQIEVTFEVDGDGILHVAAQDMASGSSHALTVTTDEALQKLDVRRHVEEAASCEIEDQQKRTLIEAQNLGRQIVYQTERCLQHLNGLSDRADCTRKRKEITDKLQALQHAIEESDVREIRRLTAEIQHASNILNHLVYGEVDRDSLRRQYMDAEGDGANHSDIVVERL